MINKTPDWTLLGKNILTISDLGKQDICNLLLLAHQMCHEFIFNERGGSFMLGGRQVAFLVTVPTTLDIIFYSAMQRLGGQVLTGEMIHDGRNLKTTLIVLADLLVDVVLITDTDRRMGLARQQVEVILREKKQQSVILRPTLLNIGDEKQNPIPWLTQQFLRQVHSANHRRDISEVQAKLCVAMALFTALTQDKIVIRDTDYNLLKEAVTDENVEVDYR